MLQEEAAWYKTQEDTYGIALDSRHTVVANTDPKTGAVNEGQVYTKGDWELWIAASTDDATLRADIVRLLYNFLNNTPDPVPFTDFYNQSTGASQGFRARPVIGAMFAILTLTAGTVSGPVSPSSSATKVGRNARR